MKKAFALSLCLALLAGIAQADLVGVWDFNADATYESAGLSEAFDADGGSQAGSALLTFTGGGAGSTNFAIDDDGTTVNAIGATPAGNNARIQRGERWNNDTLDIAFDATDLTDILLTFAADWNAGGVTGFQASWSTNDVDFTPFGAVQSFPTDAYETMTVDPGAALDGAPSATIRLTFTSDGGAAWNTGHAVRFDNFQINAVPEPASMSLLALGGLALLRRKRRTA